jgi:hypothetical protein
LSCSRSVLSSLQRQPFVTTYSHRYFARCLKIFGEKNISCIFSQKLYYILAKFFCKNISVIALPQGFKFPSKKSFFQNYLPPYIMAWIWSYDP